jgi:hypothetical protein
MRAAYTQVARCNVQGSKLILIAAHKKPIRITAHYRLILIYEHNEPILIALTVNSPWAL